MKSREAAGRKPQKGPAKLGPLFENRAWFPIEELYGENIKLYRQGCYWSCVLLGWDIIEMSLRLSFYVESERGSRKYTEKKVDSLSSYDLLEEAVRMQWIGSGLAKRAHTLRKRRNAMVHYRTALNLGTKEAERELQRKVSVILRELEGSGPGSLGSTNARIRRVISTALNGWMRSYATTSIKTTTAVLKQLFPIPRAS